MELKKQKKIINRDKQSFVKFWVKSASICSLIFLLLFTNNSSAQSIISRDFGATSPYPVGTTSTADCAVPGLACTITLPSIDPAVGYTFTIPILSGATINDIVVDNCTEPTIVKDLSAATITFPANSGICSSLNGDYIQFTVTAAVTVPPSTDIVTFKIKYKRDPIKLVFVLDISGSMSLPVFDGSGYGDTRWQVLKNAAESFLTKMELVDEPGDLIGLTYFTTDVVTSNTPLGNNLISTNGSTLVITSDIGPPRSPLNMTAMGKGLKKGKDDILPGNTNDGYKKVIFLFTDGIQNVSPLLANIGNVSYVGPVADNYRLNNAGISSSDSIFYYCIAMSIGTDVPLLLSDLATINGGAAYKTTLGTAADLELMLNFDEALTKIFIDGSPQIVANKKDVLTNGLRNLKFDINDHVSSIIFELNHKTNDSVYISKIEKDGYNLTKSFTYKNNPNFLIASLKLPYLFEKNKINSKGEWSITLSGKSESEFVVKCFVDDHNFDYACSTSKSIYTIDESIKFSTKLSFAGNSLINPNNKVSVILLKPGDDIGHLLATFSSPNVKPDTIDSGSPAYQKLMDLLNNDTAFYNALVANDQLIELTADEKGYFSGEYTDTKLTGIYQAIFMIDAQDSKFGKFIRTQKKSIVLKFGQLDPSNTDYDIKVDKGDKGQTFIINVKPKNKFGYYLGPGFLSQITINIDSIGGSISEKKDNLDGSYSFTITNIPENINSKDISITIMGEKLIVSECYPVTIWYYIILIVIILILILIRKIKNIPIKVLVWIILIVWIIYIVLRHLGYICYEFL